MRNKNRKKISTKKQKQRNKSVIKLIENWDDNNTDNYGPRLAYLDKLYDQLLSNNIRLVCVMMPRLDVENYMGGLSFFHQIKLPKLDYSNPLSNPELWKADVAVDKRHFNKKGAALFSEILVEDIKKLTFK